MAGVAMKATKAKAGANEMKKAAKAMQLKSNKYLKAKMKAGLAENESSWRASGGINMWRRESYHVNGIWRKCVALALIQRKW
jgi:hypothetical protein